MTAAAPIERLLARDRWIVAACLALACALAWVWLFRTAANMPMKGAMAAAPLPGAPAYLAGAFVMWQLMMTAMMLPSAAPMILLYARFARGVRTQGGALASTALFAGLYLALWAIFSAAAALTQDLLARAGLISAMTLRLGSGRIAGILLILAGAWQLTPMKQACLAKCRGPVSFLTRFWRPGLAGAARLGLVHGLYCLGCCWALMALLFVGGVMSLPWVVVLAVIVLVEKLAPIGPMGGRVLGAVAIAFGLALLIDPALAGF